jgi:hypothetical protein
MKRLSGLALAAAVGLLCASGAEAAPGRPILHISSHLSQAARVSVDGAAPLSAPGEGSVETPVAAGAHVLKVAGPGDVAYQGALTLDAHQLMRWHGRAYWCVNLLQDRLEPYTRDECQEEVTDGG